MATRSMIAFDNDDEVYAIYCHSDGYLSHNGKLLYEYWSALEDVEDLIALGDLSILGEEIGEKQDFDNRTSRKWCLAYGRDRGEKNTAAKTFGSIDEAVSFYDDCDYFYVFDGREWMWKRHDQNAWNELTLEDVKG